MTQMLEHQPQPYQQPQMPQPQMLGQQPQPYQQPQMQGQQPQGQPQRPWAAPAVSEKKMQQAPPVQMEQTAEGVRPAIDPKLQQVIRGLEYNGSFGGGYPAMMTRGAAPAVNAPQNTYVPNAAVPFRSNLQAANDYMKLGPQGPKSPSGISKSAVAAMEKQGLIEAIVALFVGLVPIVGIIVSLSALAKGIKLIKEPEHTGKTIAILIIAGLVVLMNFLSFFAMFFT